MILRKVTLAALAVLSGCAVTKEARLYPVDGGTILPATFLYDGTGSGVINLTLHGGDRCVGEYVTVPDGSSSWDSVFYSASSPGTTGYAYGSGGGSATYATTGLHAMGSGTMYSTSIENKQKGQALANCSSNLTIECEYVVSAMSNKGYGQCRDSAGKFYKLMF